MKQRFREDVAGVITLHPREGPHNSTGVRIGLYTPGGKTLMADGAVMLAVYVNTTLSASADEGDKVVTVALATDVKAEQEFWIGTYDTEVFELMRVKRVVSTTITFYEPLQHDHASGANFGSSHIDVDITSTHTATRGRNNRAEWQYQIDGDTHYATQLFDIVARPFKLALTPASLVTLLPYDLRRSASNTTPGRLIDEAEQRIMEDLERLDLFADELRDMAQLRTLGIDCVRMLLLERQASLDVDAKTRLDDAREQYEARLGKISETGFRWRDRDQDMIVETTVDQWGNVISSEEDVNQPKYMGIA